MSSSCAERELRNAFDRFSVWIIARNCSTSASITLHSGKTINPALRHYLLVQTTDREDEQRKLTFFEHHLTRAQFEAVADDRRKKEIQQFVNYLNIAPNCALEHFLHIANDWPTIRNLPVPEVSLVTNADLYSFNLASFPPDALHKISAAREISDANVRNVFEIRLRNGQTIREAMHRTPATIGNSGQQKKTHYPVDAKPVNGIDLRELSKAMDLCGEENQFGLFLVRQATWEDIIRYVRKHCVDQLEEVTHDTRFLVSESVPFDTPFEHHATVHEVLQDYDIVYWIRSRGSPTTIGTHFTIPFRNEYDSIPPAPAWLNVLISNATDGSTTYLERFATSAKEMDPFRNVTIVQAMDLVPTIRQPISSANDTLCLLFDARTDVERLSVATGQLLLLVDHAFVDEMGSDVIVEGMITFLNSIDTGNNRLTVWIVGDDHLWTRLTSDCKHPAVKHAMSVLNETKRKEALSAMLSNGSELEVADVIESMIRNNSRRERTDMLGNIFFFAVLAEMINDFTEGKANDTPSYWWIDVMERFVWKHIAPAGSNRLQVIEHHCYRRVVKAPSSGDPNDSVFPADRPYKHRTLKKLLAARYLADHHEMIDLETYRLFGRELLDLLLFRHQPLAIAVLHHDLKTIRQSEGSTPDALESITDRLGRNLLHIVHDSKEIENILLSVDISIEQECAQFAPNGTPLQLAIDREDWPFASRLLAAEAKLGQQTHLSSMPLKKLEEVFDDCIATGSTNLIEWILENRSDYRITQRNVYTLAVYQEFDPWFLFRLLTIAQEQRLPEREQPYQYIWDNSALDKAVDDDRLELATFLVERLDFPPTDAFNELKTLHEQRQDYERLYKLCEDGSLYAICSFIKKKSLDPRRGHNGTNLFIRAAASGNLYLLRHLYEHCGFAERINECNEDGDTALSEARQLACVDGDPIVQFLLEHGAHDSFEPMVPRRTAEEIDLPNFCSLLHFGPEGLEQLNIDHNRRDGGGELYLHYYIRHKYEPDEETFRYLLSRQDDVDVRTTVRSDLRCGETPLHLALQSNRERCWNILLDAGADVGAKSLQHGLTSLHFAIMGHIGRPMIQRLIEEYGIDVNTRDERGRSIGFYLATDTVLYRWLVERYRFDPSASDNTGTTMLHAKVKKNAFFVLPEVEYMLNVLNFSQSLTDDRGRLALHYAVELGNLSVVRLLLKYRQDLCNVPDVEGMTAVQLAHSLNLDAICELFRSIV